MVFNNVEIVSFNFLPFGDEENRAVAVIAAIVLENTPCVFHLRKIRGTGRLSV